MSSVLALLAAYLLGALPFGYILARWVSGTDIRKAGSGNIGATNVFRTAGPAAGLATLALDMGKGYLAVWLAGRLTSGNIVLMSMAALAAIVGHAFPVFLKFRGGKAMATYVGAFLCLTPIPVAAMLVVFLVTVVYSRHISVGSILGAGTLPLAEWLIERPPPFVLLASVVAGAFVIGRHRANIRRLREGTERVFTLSSKGRSKYMNWYTLL